MALFDDIPGADETYIQFSATHWHGNAVSDKRNDRLFDAIGNFLRWQPESLACSPELTPTMLVTDRKREDGVCMVFSITNPNVCRILQLNQRRRTGRYDRRLTNALNAAVPRFVPT